jgi:UDP-3-O-[3-hydroxymyristoyl] glucosamine N-acyltransferase
VVYARAGVSKSWPAGSKLFGSPARDVREYWKEAAALKRLIKGESR